MKSGFRTPALLAALAGGLWLPIGANAQPTGQAPSPAEVVVDGRTLDLGLVCFGDGQAPRLSTSKQWTWNKDQDRYDYGDRVEVKREHFDAAVTIQLWDGGGRIRLPQSLIPPINSRGDRGWWELTEVNATSGQITAQYRLNGMNKPQLTIDRRSGRIVIHGTADYAFRGECDQMDHSDRRF